MGRKASKERENPLIVSLGHRGIKKGKASSSRLNMEMNKNRPLKPQKVEPLVKEEGEMSDDEEVYEKFKEEKWMEWCEEMMADSIKTLNRLERLQTISANLPKDTVYLSLAFFICLCHIYLLNHPFDAGTVNSHIFSFRCLRKLKII